MGKEGKRYRKKRSSQQGGTFYNHTFRSKRDENSYEKRREALRGHIRKVFEDGNQIFGVAKIVAILREQGINTTIETVRQLMREMGLVSVRKGAKKQYEDESRKTRNIVNRNFQVVRPNAVWVSDVTFFRFNDLHYCICIIMDLYGCKYRSEKELREGVARCIRFYNSECPHKSLSYKTPNQKKQEYWTAVENYWIFREIRNMYPDIFIRRKS